MYFQKRKIMNVLRKIGSPGINYNEYAHERSETRIICNTIMTQSNQVTLMNTEFFDIPPSRRRQSRRYFISARDRKPFDRCQAASRTTII